MNAVCPLCHFWWSVILTRTVHVTQVANLMLHPEKAVQRSQLPADRTPPVLCQPSLHSTNPALAAAYGSAEANGDALEETAELDPDSYDDADFYQELLKDLLAGSPSALGPTMASVKVRVIRLMRH